MIFFVLEIFFVFVTGLMLTYIVRHYIFTVTVQKRVAKTENADRQRYGVEPTVRFLFQRKRRKSNWTIA